MLVYHLQANGQVEVTNRTITTILKRKVGSNLRMGRLDTRSHVDVLHHDKDKFGTPTLHISIWNRCRSTHRIDIANGANQEPWWRRQERSYTTREGWDERKKGESPKMRRRIQGKDCQVPQSPHLWKKVSTMRPSDVQHMRHWSKSDKGKVVTHIGVLISHR